MGPELTDGQVSTLNDVFSAFEDADVTYVVLRRFDGYPDCIPGDGQHDLDVLVAREDFDDAVEISTDLGFSRPNAGRNGLSGLALKVVKNPLAAVRLPLTAPSRARSMVSTAAAETTSTQSKTPYQTACENGYAHELVKDGVVLDLTSHLTHVSPLNQVRIRLDPDVERKLFERRTEREHFYTPAPPDELAHVVAHCVFEYDGSFPEYYRDRCETLTAEMSDEEWRQFDELLSHVFFAASEVVYECVQHGEYDDIRSRLASYSKY